MIRWARLRLPTEQVARSHWKEVEKGMENVRVSRVVKVCVLLIGKPCILTPGIQLHGTEERFGEVLYYCRLPVTYGDVDGELKTVAMVSLFGSPDAELLEKSYGTVRCVRYEGDLNLIVIDVKTIHSVVAMLPLPEHLREDEPAPVVDEAYTAGCSYFVVDKLGLDIVSRAWTEEVPEDE